MSDEATGLRATLLAFAWVSVPGLPILILLIRSVLGLTGWATALYMITAAPLITVLGAIPAGAAFALPKELYFSPALRCAVAAFAVWCLANIFGFGFVVSDLSDVEDYPSPLSDLIPYELEFPILGICFAVAFASMIISMDAIFRAASQQKKADASQA